jgi:hypothetical protein
LKIELEVEAGSEKNATINEVLVRIEGDYRRWLVDSRETQEEERKKLKERLKAAKNGIFKEPEEEVSPEDQRMLQVTEDLKKLAKDLGISERVEKESQRLDDEIAGRSRTMSEEDLNRHIVVKKPDVSGPAIVLRGLKLTYNGEPLMGAAFEDVVRMLGETPRDPFNDGKPYVFDKAGLGVSVGAKSKRVISLEIHLNFKPNPYNTPSGVTPGQSIYPLNAFKGYVDILGAIVLPTSNVDNINEALARTGILHTLYCGSFALCETETVINGKYLGLSVYPDSKHKYHGTIYTLSIGIWDTKYNPMLNPEESPEP